MNELATMIVETKSVPGSREQAQFHDRPVVLDQEMLHHELRALRQHLVQFGERAGDEIGLRAIVTGQRVGAFDRPVYLVIDMVEERRVISVLELCEQFSQISIADRDPPAPLSWTSVSMLGRHQA
jgi:hypothetical protein